MSAHKKVLILSFPFLSFLLLTKPAYADIGVPMIFVTLPYMVIGLIPIILIESYVLVKKLKIPFKQTIRISVIINIVSTIIGIPITWVFLVLFQMVTGGGRSYGLQTSLQKFLAVTWQSPWLIPYESDLNWMIPSATLVLLIPFFFASWFIEYRIAKNILKQIWASILKKGIFAANLISYTILFAFTVVWLIIAIKK